MYKDLKSILKILSDECLLVEIRNPLNINLDKYIVSGTIKTDTRTIRIGDIFSCIKGFNVDGHDFSAEALAKGASILIVESKQFIDVTQIVVTDSKKATAIISKYIYDNPSEKFHLIGVTGTNGKTTTTFILDQLYQQKGHKTGLIGTLGYKIGDKFYESDRTTPDIVQLNEIFYKMAEAGCTVVIMEVSSHALTLGRVFGIKFNVGIFTNLTQDHLDFHKDMIEYGEAKYLLFKMVQENNGVCIINTDDEFGKTIYNRISGTKISYSMNHADWVISDIKTCSVNTEFKLQNDDKLINIISPLVGKFNVYNLTAAIVACRSGELRAGRKQAHGHHLRNASDAHRELALVRSGRRPAHLRVQQ